MKSLTRLWQVLLQEIGEECGIRTDRDYKTLLDREKHEGLSFLTITLPSFAADFERSLELGMVASDSFLSFKKRGGLPVFLSGFLKLVFLDSGRLKDDASISAIRGIRQLCLFYKKIELECTPRRKAKAIEAFLSCEKELAQVELQLEPYRVKAVARQAHILFGDVFDKMNRLVDDFDLNPRHGPGNTADRKVGNQKFSQFEWTSRLEEYFPFGEYVLPNWRHIDSWPVSFLSPEQERPVKVTLVPKTQKTPRIIAQEPTCMQYMQQALMKPLVTLLEEDPLAGPFVGFSSQEENRQAAREGSLSGELATLDLSEASDRVLNVLVEAIFSPWPSLAGAVQATRSTTAQLPNGETLPLKKFASMGSALCFPVEEIVFLAIILSQGTDESTVRSRGELMNLHGLVRVFGDDIVVPVDMVQGTIEGLESFGLRVNSAKSFWIGKFRESCGGDFYSGEWVTPIRMSRMPPRARGDVASVVSTMELCNNLYEVGLWKTAHFLLSELQRLGYGRKTVPRYTAALAPWSFTNPASERLLPNGRWDNSGYPWDKIHRDHQNKVVHVEVVRPILPHNGLDGLPALRKTLAGDFYESTNREHLSSSGRPLNVHTKRGWVAVGT